jgi:hypothetical protein
MPRAAGTSGALPALRSCHALTLPGRRRRIVEVVCLAAKPLRRATAHAIKPIAADQSSGMPSRARYPRNDYAYIP